MKIFSQFIPSVVFFSAVLAPAARAADNFKPESGFVSLFNGRDLTGWCYRDGAKTDEKVAVAFDGKAVATDGRFSAKDGVFIVHPREPRLAQKIWTTRRLSWHRHEKLSAGSHPENNRSWM